MSNWEVSFPTKIKSPFTMLSWKTWNVKDSQIQKEITFKCEHSNLQELYLLSSINLANVLPILFTNSQQVCWKWSKLGAQSTSVQETHSGKKKIPARPSALQWLLQKAAVALTELYFCSSALKATTKVSNVPINLCFKTLELIGWAEQNQAELARDGMRRVFPCTSPR